MTRRWKLYRSLPLLLGALLLHISPLVHASQHVRHSHLTSNQQKRANTRLVRLWTWDGYDDYGGQLPHAMTVWEIRHALDRGANINARSKDGTTGLMWASETHNLAAAKFLLAQGVDVNATKDGGWTALINAVTSGDAPMFHLLLAHGADAYVKMNEGDTILMMACGADEDAYAIVQWLLAHGANVNAKANDGGTALIVASRSHHADIVQLLLAKGAEVNAHNHDRETALSVAGDAIDAPTSVAGDLKLVTILVAHGADIKGQSGVESLIGAAGTGHVSVAQFLLAHGANVNGKGQSGETALSMASSQHNTQIIKVLKAAGAN